MVIEKGFCDNSGCNNWPECNYQSELNPPCAKRAVEKFTSTNTGMLKLPQFMEMFHAFMSSQSYISGNDSKKILTGFTDFVERQLQHT
jgi:hypothetical protein